MPTDPAIRPENPDGLARCGWCHRRVTERDRAENPRYWMCGACGFATPVDYSLRYTPKPDHTASPTDGGES